MKRRIVVIGGVAAGPSAASKAKRVNPDADVVLYEAGEHVSFGVCEIPYFIGGEITDPDKLVIYTPEKLQREKGVEAYTHHYVEQIVTSKKEIQIRDLRNGTSKKDRYDKLIVATGAIPKKMGIEGEKSRNVFHIKELSSAYALKNFIQTEKPRSAVIIGAGFIGLEMVEALTKIGIDVTVVHNSEFPMSTCEPEIRTMIRQKIESKKIKFIGNAQVEWFGVGTKNNVVAVGTKNETIETDLVIIAIGVEPNSLLAKNSGLKIGKLGGIVTNDRMNISGSESVFAAGDCCELKNIVTQKPMFVSLATTASKTGWVAGENAAGGLARFKGAVKAIGVKFFDLEIAQVGLSRREAMEHGFSTVQSTITASTKVGMMPGNEKITITTLADKKSAKLLGANLAGGSGAILRSNIFATAIRHGLTVHEFSELDIVYTPPASPLWDAVILSGLNLKKQF